MADEDDHTALNRHGISSRALLHLEREYLAPMRAEIGRLRAEVDEVKDENKEQFRLHSETRAKVNEMAGKLDANIGTLPRTEPAANHEPAEVSKAKAGLYTKLGGLVSAVTALAMAAVAYFQDWFGGGAP